jgi:hypothetical protein
VIFFWSNENNEPVHVHIGIVEASPNTTKVWLTKGGGCMLANNVGKIPKSDLNELLEFIQANYFRICSQWKKHFETNDLKFYC